MSRVVFFGTPEEAVPTLEMVADRHDVFMVVTQPDRPKGRSGRPFPPPVKEAATALGIPVTQPADRAGLEKAVRNAGAFDVGVVVAYGRILPLAVLEVPAHGFLNVHFSLLPRWRGAAPVARALMAGDPMSGVTIIRLDEGLDTGPVLTAQAIDIHPSEDARSLSARLAILGARLLVTVLPGYLTEEVVPIPQSEEGATYAERITAKDRDLSGDTDPAAFLGRVRGLAPEPGAVLLIDGEPHQVLAARAHGDPPAAGTWEAKDGFPVVGVGGQGIALLTLQPPGRRPMSGDAWLRGRRRDGGTLG